MSGDAKGNKSPRYWICDECADKQGLVHWKEGNTKILSWCGHCDKDEMVLLTPIVDLRKPRICRDCDGNGYTNPPAWTVKCKRCEGEGVL